MTEREAMAYIGMTNELGSVLGLDSMRELCKRLGNPQDQLQFVHIAGTNGKGSTLAYVSTILKEAGYKVGRYISPTILEYRERIQVNGRNISAKSFAEYVERVSKVTKQMTDEGLAHPTSFEVETVIGFLYFFEKKCDIVVLETGLGGCLDATNIITTTKVAVITSISMDHMRFLGNTLEKIATEKAGIIKIGCCVITIEQKPEAMEVIKKCCKEHHVPLSIAKPSDAKKVHMGLEKQKFTYGEFGKVEIHLAGSYQIDNAVLALEVIKLLRKSGMKISGKAVLKGMAETRWIGRFSVVAKKPLFIMDGAHNEDGARRLAESIQFYFTNKRIVYIMGILRDKEYEKIIKLTVSYATHVITVATPNNQRTIQAYDLAQVVKEYHNSVTVADSIEEAVEMAYLLASKEDVIIAFGSLSYLGDLNNVVAKRKELRSDTHGR